MVTPATKTIKVTEATHRALKVIAAQQGERVYETVARLVKETRNGNRTTGKRRRLCRKCGGELTSADDEAGKCTQCGKGI